MSEPFLAEIIMFGGNFAPRGWAFCSGQVMAIAQNTALFSLLGTTFGGNGQTTFALPDLRGRVPIHAGQGPGLSSYVLGEVSGTENNTLLTSNLPALVIPAQNVTIHASNESDSSKPIGRFPGSTSAGNGWATTSDGTVLNAAAATIPQIVLGGGSQPVPNIQPFLCVNFIICLEGIFPSRN
jgi:microcystin-dependent protein